MQRSKAGYQARKTQSDIMAFKGLNNTENHSENQLLDMKNISSNKYPFISQRPAREEIQSLSNGKYLFASDKLCWVDGLDFYYDGVSKGTLSNDPTCIVEMNDFIVIFPDEVYYDKVNDTWGSFNSGYDINFATVNDNRMFAVSGNRLLASKQGDFKIWDSFQGISTDSYAAYVGTQGDFIGLTTYQDHVTAFKNEYIHELYGNMPANYTIPEALKKGIKDQLSVAELDGRLIFMSDDGIYQYSGGLPRKISNNMKFNFVNGVAATNDNKYYINLFDGSQYRLLVYDSRYREWHIEDDIQIEHFSKYDNELHALTSDNKIIKFNSGTETVDWFIETQEFDNMTFEKKSYRELFLNLELEIGAMVTVYLSSDDNPYRPVKTIMDAKRKHFRVPINLLNVRTFQIKIVGSGSCIIKNVRRKFDIGGRINA